MNHQARLAVAAAIALSLTACSGIGTSIPGPSQAGAQRSGTSGGGLEHAHVMRTAFAPYQAQPNAHLTYRNGFVDRIPAIYVVYWGFNASGADPSGEQKYLTKFLKGVGKSPWLNIDHQYYQIEGGVTQHIRNPGHQLKGTWVDPSSVPSSPTDSQIQAEAAAAEQHFGYDLDASYVVATPHNHNSSGFGTQYCAYHQRANSPDGQIAYTNLPYMTDAGRNCGENFVNPGGPGVLDGVSIVEGHELAETQTDPFPFSGWDDSLNGEIGDICAWQVSRTSRCRPARLRSNPSSATRRVRAC